MPPEPSAESVRYPISLRNLAAAFDAPLSLQHLSQGSASATWAITIQAITIQAITICVIALQVVAI